MFFLVEVVTDGQNRHRTTPSGHVPQDWDTHHGYSPKDAERKCEYPVS